jgi:predicted amidohydrolase YtcJ
MLTSSSVSESARRATAANVPLRIRLIDFPVTDMSSWREPASRTMQGTAYVSVSGTKWILDGTPIERLAFLREPYTDHQDSRRQLNFRPEQLAGYLQKAIVAGDQPMFHAVGDAAIDTVLDGLERSGGRKWVRLRPRIENGDMLEPFHFERARRFGVIVVQNPSHFMLAPTMKARLGDRAGRASMMKSMIAAKVPVALGSDGPLNPYLNVMFATMIASNPSEAMTREQASGAYTLGSARAEFSETQKGTIALGMLADLAMLSQDTFTVPTKALPATTSVLTLVGGRVAFEKNANR